jgi:enoyl-CoA hydratase/carnithine racemase
MGLVNRVLPDDALDKYVEEYAATIAGNAPLTVDAVKFIIGETVKFESERDLQACDDKVATCFASSDYVEGRAAFLEKRKPQFTGT